MMESLCFWKRLVFEIRRKFSGILKGWNPEDGISASELQAHAQPASAATSSDSRCSVSYSSRAMSSLVLAILNRV